MHNVNVRLSLAFVALSAATVSCGNDVTTRVPDATREDVGAPVADALADDGQSELTDGELAAVDELDDMDDDEAQDAIPAPDTGDADHDETHDAPSGDVTEAAAATASPTCDSNAHTGFYCGGDKVSHANSNVLYECHGPGPATVEKACAGSCKVAPPGEDDYCIAPAPTCASNANTGDYCGGDKVNHANANTLYFCSGPGPATKITACSDGCVVAPAGQDDHCHVPQQSCPHHSLMKWGLTPRQSDRLRCGGVGPSRVWQTIGSAAASAGTHAQDGTINGHPYSAATDIDTSGWTDAQVKNVLSDLADQGFAAFFRKPGKDGWPSSEVRHLHVIYVKVPMKSSLRAQVQDWLNGKNGLTSHSTYTFWQASGAQKDHIRALFQNSN